MRLATRILTLLFGPTLGIRALRAAEGEKDRGGAVAAGRPAADSMRETYGHEGNLVDIQDDGKSTREIPYDLPHHFTRPAARL